jgi:hypothetical protein
MIAWLYYRFVRVDYSPQTIDIAELVRHRMVHVPLFLIRKERLGNEVIGRKGIVGVSKAEGLRNRLLYGLSMRLACVWRARRVRSDNFGSTFVQSKRWGEELNLGRLGKT